MVSDFKEVPEETVGFFLLKFGTSPNGIISSFFIFLVEVFHYE